MEKFYAQKYCDRCGGSLDGGRIMSMYNADCICMSCKQKEMTRPDYHDAQEAERAEVARGNRNFQGIGLKN